MKHENLEINLLHYTTKERIVSYGDIARHVDYLDSEDLEPTNFWGACGGFEVTVDGFKTIFRNLEFYVLLRAIDFLLCSLFWIKGNRIGWFDIDHEFPNDVVARFQSGNFIRLQRGEAQSLLFSFLPTDMNKFGLKGTRFFSSEIINREEWCQKARLALSQYFDVLVKVIDKEPDHPQSKVLKAYQDLWEMERV